MGIARQTANCMLLYGKKNPFQGSILQLGRQDIHFGMKELKEWAARHEVALKEGAPVALTKRPIYRNRECIDDITYFCQIGFTEVHSCDVSDYEKAEYVFSMNYPSPEGLSDRFDLVFDGGTLEHVFHFPQALANIHRMLKVGGRVIHASPVSNYVDHGFYSFSPTVFFDYYAANLYSIESAFLVGATKDPFAEAALFSYSPGSIDHLSFGGFSAETVGKFNVIDIFFVARKLAHSTSGIIPTQRRFRQLWGEKLPAGLQPFQLLGMI